MFGFSSSEILIIFLIVCVLSMTGMWPSVIKAIRELRGERVDEPPISPTSHLEAQNLDLCYRMLGLSPSATWDQIERAYRQKAKLHHPDRGGDADTMRALNDAYSQLKKARRSG